MDKATDKGYIGIRDLEPGGLYINDSGYVYMFLGRIESDGSCVFYEIANGVDIQVNYVQGGNTNYHTIYDYDMWVDMLKVAVKYRLNNMDGRWLEILKRPPKLISSVDEIVVFENIKRVKKFVFDFLLESNVAKSKIGNKKLVVVNTLEKTAYLSTKDIKIGHYYCKKASIIGDEGIVVFLGRDSDRNFLWANCEYSDLNKIVNTYTDWGYLYKTKNKINLIQCKASEYRDKVVEDSDIKLARILLNGIKEPV